MTQASVAEVVGALRARYLRARRGDKTMILDEFVALTGYHRKAAIRVLRNGRRPQGRNRRGRPRVYTPDVKAALLQVWEVCGRICSKRLAPFLPEIVSVLEREGELAVAPDTRRLLVQLSPATIDRMLVTHRYRRDTGRPATKPGTLLKAKVPVRTFADWEAVGPGFLELDLVAHCGETTAGEYLHTLNAVDVATLWCEPVAVLNRSQEVVRKAIQRIRERLPFPLRGIDSDNDSAFLNAHLYPYCQREGIQFTRSRPYKKNDQAYVEGKNWCVVRQLVGYHRYESQEACDLLAAIYADWRLMVNYFQPVRNLIAKERVGSKVRKRYDRAQTPHQRVLAASDVPEEKKVEAEKTYNTLNPAGLQRRIEANLRALARLPR
ncbi:MAG: Mobile element protein [Candidatus Bipolaricaulis sibiricus]|uniref:Mobile element protein n=1 Tax=Bipolaricaulis sibiricus TaxID=2501609 RepID=A0A410FS34_BIPS1|nr:MAG: Mobile element protein [Candidatus Bipolaricaulis sibiricus]